MSAFYSSIWVFKLFHETHYKGWIFTLCILNNDAFLLFASNDTH